MRVLVSYSFHIWSKVPTDSNHIHLKKTVLASRYNPFCYHSRSSMHVTKYMYLHIYQFYILI